MFTFLNYNYSLCVVVVRSLEVQMSTFDNKTFKKCVGNYINFILHPFGIYI